MKYLVTTLALLLAAGAAAGFAVYRLNCRPDLQAAAAEGDALQWLQTDFRLNDEQFAAIRALHDAYDSVCEAHCRAIQDATQTRNRLADDAAASSDVRAAADARLEDLRRECETAITRHVQEVAALMPPDEGRRYLALVLPKIPDFDHRAAPGIDLGHSH